MGSFKTFVMQINLELNTTTFWILFTYLTSTLLCWEYLSKSHLIWEAPSPKLQAPSFSQAPSCLRSDLFTNFSTLILFKLNDMIVRFNKNPKLITNTNGLAVYSLSATMCVKVWYNWFAGWFIFGIEQMLQKFVI